MINGKDLHTFNCEAMATIGMNAMPWEQCSPETHRWAEKIAELVNTHFTASSTALPQEPLTLDIIEALGKMPQEKQELVYHFLHRIGHRIYK